MSSAPHGSQQFPLNTNNDLEVDIELPNYQTPSENKDALLSFYDHWTSRQRYCVLIIASMAVIMVPLVDTIYLPALKEVEDDLNAPQSLVALSVSINLLLGGFSSLLWGPSSDKFGRKVVYVVATVSLIATTVVCIFAPTIGILVAFRALQGIAVAAFVSLGGGSVADVFPPEQLGTANGYLMVPLLLGPIIGPLLGGGLSQAYGWRSTMICLAVFSGAILFPVIVFFLPETQSFKALQRLKASDPDLASRLEDAELIESSPPVFNPPWVPLRYVFEWAIFPHALVALITFGSLFASLTEFPIALAASPYSLSTGIIGVCYLPQGVGSLIASPLFGRLSDYAAAQHPSEPEARLMYSTLSTLLIMPPSLLLYGWALDFKTNLAACLIGQFFIGAGCASYLPGIFGYLTAIKQSSAGAASAAVQTSMFSSAGVLIIVSSVAVNAIGMGPFFTILAGLQAVFSLAAFVLIIIQRRKKRPAIIISLEEEVQTGQVQPSSL